MFAGTAKPRKSRERAAARRLREREGFSYKRIAVLLGVSASSVFHWTRDIQISEQQRKRNLAHMTPGSEVVSARAATWRELNRARRLAYQREGRSRARLADPIHQAGCMLYWAEGSKERNSVVFSNSDLHMVRFFHRFLTRCFLIQPNSISMRLNVYTGNGFTLREIEDHWLNGLGLPRSCLRKHSINHFPTSSSGRRKDRLPFGVCTLKLNDTGAVQHIFGAIQEYAGFDEPRWLDCSPRAKTQPKPD